MIFIFILLSVIIWFGCGLLSIVILNKFMQLDHSCQSDLSLCCVLLFLGAFSFIGVLFMFIEHILKCAMKKLLIKLNKKKEK